MSSEALERARLVRQARAVPESRANALVNALADQVEALLAEVARLEQERDEWQASYRLQAKMTIDAGEAALAAEAALAVAREREQRLRDAARLYRKLVLPFEFPTGSAAGEALDAALVDEPAAATLTEPEQAEAQGEAAASRSGQGSPDGNAQGSGSASAAADEPATVLACPECGAPLQLGHDCLAAADDGRCPGCGWYVADCNCVARAAADEPGETPA